MGIGAGGPQSAAVLGAEEPVQCGDHHHQEKNRQRQGVAQGKLPDIPLGNQQVILIHADGQVGLASHEPQVHGVQGKLGQNTGQDGGDAAAGMEEARDKARQHAREKGAQQGDPGIAAQAHQHDAQGAAGSQSAVHRQVRHIQDPVGHIDADGHNAPQEALGHRAG